MENNNENLNSEQKMAEVKAWLAYADMDFNTADHLLNGAFYPLSLRPPKFWSGLKVSLSNS